MSDWFSYQICDKSGCGFKEHKFVYAPRFKEDDAKEYVLHNLETWALYAESYTLKIHMDASPPPERVAEEMVNVKESIVALTKQLRKLRAKPAGTDDGGRK